MKNAPTVVGCGIIVAMQEDGGMATIEEFCGKMENVESIGNLFM